MKNIDGQTGKFIRKHLTKELHNVVISMPDAGWFNLALQTENFVEGADFLIIPWDDSPDPNIRRLFGGRQCGNDIVFIIRLTQKDAEEACRLAMQEPQFIQENESMIEMTSGQCSNADTGFAYIAGGYYASLNTVDIKKRILPLFGIQSNTTEFWEKAEKLDKEFQQLLWSQENKEPK